MILIIRCLLIGLHFCVACVVGLIIGLLRPFHPTNSRWCAQLFSRPGCKILGITLEHYGLDKFPTDRPFVVVANHQSNWDLYVVGSIVPERTVSIGKKSLKWLPIFGQIYWLAGNILIDRGNHAKAMQAMQTSKEALLEHATNIWFFAEGTRNHGANMLPFKKGAFATAINAQVPIVPVCCSAYLQKFSLSRMDNGTARLSVLPPVETAGMTTEDLTTLLDQVHDQMTTEIDRLT